MTHSKSDIGIVGGGQLGLMICEAANKMGFSCVVLDPAKDCPAFLVAQKKIVANFDDKDALFELASSCKVLTYEFENVSLSALKEASKSTPIYPSLELLKTTQNRIKEKTALQKAGVAVTPFFGIKSKDDLFFAIDGIGFPGVLKTTTMGYDGKGQRLVGSKEELENAYFELNSSECIYEQRIDLLFEVSSIIARNKKGEITLFTPCQNTHTNHILDFTTSPAEVPPSVVEKANSMAKKAAEALNLVGLMAVEMFVDQNEQVLFNEIAPRPHNSGHHTIESCRTSQYEQLVRILMDMPLGDTTQTRAAAMVNLLGEIWLETKRVDEKIVQKSEDAYLHIYGKKDAKRGRKMGHITVLADTPKEALSRAISLRKSFAN